MFLYKIKVQSYIDIITNSSTEIFCVANNISCLKEFINSVLKLTHSDVDIEDLCDIITIPDEGKILDAIHDEEDWVMDVFKRRNIDKDHFLNALNFSSVGNLLPIDSYLEQFGLNYVTICQEFGDEYYNDEWPLEYEYVLLPKKGINIDSDIVGHLNKILNGFAHKLYNITESYC